MEMANEFESSFKASAGGATSGQEPGNGAGEDNIGHDIAYQYFDFLQRENEKLTEDIDWY